MKAVTFGLLCVLVLALTPVPAGVHAQGRGEGRGALTPRDLFYVAVPGRVNDIGYGGVGTLLATMSANTRLREVLLPVLMLPIAIPALLASVKCTAGALDGRPFDEWSSWFGLLVAFDLTMLGASFLTYDFIVEE